MIEKIGDYKLINDAFPGIGAKLKLFWGHPEFNVLMDELLVYKRGVPREDFRPRFYLPSRRWIACTRWPTPS